MGNFTNFLKAGFFMALLLFVGQSISAQTFPNGSQDLDDVNSGSGGTLIADSDPAPFNTADLYGYILVDVNNATVGGDLDDNSIVGFSTDGTFTGVPTGDYVIYYISYDASDAGTLQPFLGNGQDMADLLALGTQGPAGTWTSTDPGFVIVASDLATVVEDGSCDDFTVIHQAICNSANDGYDVLLVFQGGNAGANGYNVTDNVSGGTITNITSNSISFGPFASPDGDGYSYTVTVADNPQCSFVASASLVDCIVTSVELTRFDGTAVDNGNELTWSVATEQESDYYTVQYADNGVDFKNVGTVATTGNSNIEKSYTFLHEETTEGLHYYRLLETDKDGVTRAITSVISVTRAGDNVFTIVNIYPIPAVDDLNVEFIAQDRSTATVEVVDITGKIIDSKNFEAQAGTNTVQMDASSYAAGTYFISISTGDQVVTQKFVKN